MELDAHQDRVYISRLLEGYIRMISKINIWVEIGILDDALFIVRNYQRVETRNIKVEEVDFR